MIYPKLFIFRKLRTLVATIIFVIMNAKITVTEFRLFLACCTSILNAQLLSLHRNVFEVYIFIKASQIVFERNAIMCVIRNLVMIY